jgi:YD repeat-containing protein
MVTHSSIKRNCILQHVVRKIISIGTSGIEAAWLLELSYDAGDHLTQVIDSLTGTINRVTDGLDRLTSETTPPGTVSYAYDSDDRRTSTTVTGRTPVNYTYDNGNRLTLITQGTSNVGFGYDNTGRRSTLTLPNGINVSYGYDQGSQLAGITYQLGGTTLGNLTYSYDLAGRRSGVSGSFARTASPSPLSSASYDVANRLTQWSGTTLSYDANGNLINDGVNTYTWDARNHLASISGGTTASFQYDPFGRRVTRNILGSATNFLYDGGNSIQELSSGSPTADVTSGGVDEAFARSDSTGISNYLLDAQGSSVALTDSFGTVQTQYAYEPFGKTTATGSPQATLPRSRVVKATRQVSISTVRAITTRRCNDS